MWRKLFEQYRLLPRRMAVAYSRRLPACVDVDDLEQWGLIGLMEAARRFDPDRDVRFTTFAGRRIHGAMVDGIRSMDWAPRLSRNRGEKITKLVSLETIIADGKNPVSLEDTLESHEPQPGRDAENADEVGNLLRGLRKHHREIFETYYVQDHSSKDLAESLGLTQSRIFQILGQCRGILRERLERETA